MTTSSDPLPASISAPSPTAAKSPAKTASGVLTWPRFAFMASAVLLAISNLYEYWHLVLNAPQYPGGLKVTLFTHKLEGDVREVDGLNHYIGMMPLGDAASFERSIATFAMVAFVLLGILAGVLNTRKSAWLAVPIIVFPIAFVADLWFWLYRAGHNLDPTAALSSSIKPFTPAILGRGVVGQFSTDAMFGAGFWMATLAGLIALAALVARLRSRNVSS